ncbi:patatin-like phospholipase family protein [Mycobacterium sp. E2238]|uniref:patatin-like phospholipase family protein n=1 Tax=Mycobacterium sp. E2238 TaxID=1834131 RepID=UPI0007FFB0B1|nr:patatin-like phospholipase family protein [Mycobacterium sp. E2238]OBI25672.1 patatin [Mycobacterium sp. E2238]
MTTRRALVLAGGGIAGIAWETGVLRGIADVSPTVADLLLGSDVLVGTSAGAAVAATIGTGSTLDVLFDRQVAESSAEIDSGVDVEEITEMFLAALAEPFADPLNKTRQQMQRIGAVALATKTVPPPVRREVVAQRLPSHHWPDRALRITAIDVETGELVVFDRESGVDLVDAVAASCAVPGAWPPVAIAGRRYMDGGIASSVNLGAAGDCDTAVVLVPSGVDTPSAFGDGPAAEISAFAGTTYAVFADADSLAAFGPNPLDPACRVVSALAGREQGRREARGVARFLGV